MNFEIEKKSFLAAPPFWRTRIAEIEEEAARFKHSDHGVIGTSAGGRPIHCFAYGRKEDLKPTATFSSAIASGNPSAFVNPKGRGKPVLMIVGAIHGQEVEGTAAAMNLLSVLERGVDLRGKPWPRLAEIAHELRIVVVPLANPDGRERIPINNMIGGSVDDVHYYGQGVTKDGKLLTWPEVKQWQPIPLDMVSLLGGYYNDLGVNVQHDDFVVNPAPETRALLALAKSELPDVVVMLHGCGNAPTFTGTERFLPDPYRARQAHLEAVVLYRLQREGFAAIPPRVEPVAGFGFHLALFMASGCVPLCFELPHGLEIKPFTFDDILDIGLIGFEEIVSFGREFGYRPRTVV